MRNDQNAKNKDINNQGSTEKLSQSPKNNQFSKPQSLNNKINNNQSPNKDLN